MVASKLDTALANLKASGVIGSTELTLTQKAEALIAELETLQITEDTVNAEAAAQATLDEKRAVFLQKKDEFMTRTGARLTAIATTANTYNLSDFVANATVAFTEIKNEMIAEMQGE